MTEALLVLNHGSRDEAANAEFEAVVAAYRARSPGREIAHGYVELARPNFTDVLAGLAEGHERVVVLPLLLFAAGHVKNDVPLALAAARRRFPHVRFDAARPLGVHPSLAALAFERALEAGPIDAESAARTAVLVVGRGSSDPDANGDFCKQARLLGEGRGFQWLLPCFVGITRPLFEETAELAARLRPESLLVLPYFLFAGQLIGKLEKQTGEFAERYPWIKTRLAPPLGTHEAIFALMDERVREASTGEATLPCDNCHYRTAIGGVAEQVGGLKALLWSVRHMLTHSRAMPHAHAHKALRKHVLVCGNVDCAAQGSIALLSALRRCVKEAGLEQAIHITRTSCMGRCGEGPTVAVYPDGVWYRAVRESDAEEVFREHLSQDRIVARLVDNIMH